MSLSTSLTPRAAAVALLDALRVDRVDCLDEASDYDGDDQGWVRTIGGCAATVLCAGCWLAASGWQCVVGDAIGHACARALAAQPENAALDDLLEMVLAPPMAFLAPMDGEVIATATGFSYRWAHADVPLIVPAGARLLDGVGVGFKACGGEPLTTGSIDPTMRYRGARRARVAVGTVIRDRERNDP